MLTGVAIAFALFFAGLWMIYWSLEGDAEDATERFSNAIFGKFVGAAGAIAVLTGEIANMAGELMAIIMQIPSVIIALLGFGALSGNPEMSPGGFLVVALIVFLGAKAVSSSRAG